MFYLTIGDLSNACGVSVATLYNLFKKNKDFIEQNSKRYSHKIKYNKAVLDFCLEAFEKDTRQEQEITPPDASNSDAVNNTSSNDISLLEANIKALEAKLEAKEKECAELIKQNGALLLLLSQEMEQQKLYLPAPKKSFGQKIKDLFGKKEP